MHSPSSMKNFNFLIFLVQILLISQGILSRCKAHSFQPQAFTYDHSEHLHYDKKSSEDLKQEYFERPSSHTPFIHKNVYAPLSIKSPNPRTFYNYQENHPYKYRAMAPSKDSNELYTPRWTYQINNYYYKSNENRRNVICFPIQDYSNINYRANLSNQKYFSNDQTNKKYIKTAIGRTALTDFEDS
uniref:Uncharacterized protein n=1 Tax=Lepeophtheirus salmonis TaxID=72036 RepID=A0A0K2T2V0_LEPSM